MADFLAKILDIKKKLFTPKQESVIGVDIGSSSVKIVQLRKDKGRVFLETYGELSCGPYNNLAIGQATSLPMEKQAEVIRDLIKEANVTTTAGALSVPLRSSLLLTLEVPDMARADLEKVIPIEARKYIPVAISEVALDWWIIPKQKGEDTIVTTENPDKPSKNLIEVLVVAIHKDTIKLYENLAKAVALTTDFFEIETFSAIRSVMKNDLTANVIVDLGAASTKVAIIDYGIIRLSHTINKGSQDITVAISRSLGVAFNKAEEIKRRVGLVERPGEENIQSSVNPVIEYIFSELNRVMISYQEKHRRAIGKVVLIGGGALLKGLGEVAAKSVEVPIIMGTPFDKTEAPAFLTPILKEAGPGFAVALGLALRSLQEH